MKRLLLVALLLLPSSVRSAEKPLSKAEAERAFTLKILPLLKQKCLGCHGEKPDRLRGDYDVRTREALLKGGESEKAAIVPGHPEKSPLYQAIQWKNDLEMPPKENDRLDKEQIELIRRWIIAGAPWPDEKTQAKYQKENWSLLENNDGVLVKTSGGLDDEWTYRRYKLDDIWAFQPVKRPGVPQGFRNPIDAFIQSKLSDAKINSAPRANALTLIRRATYDLTGLPPTPKEIEQFLADSKRNPEKAWLALIDRLLKSPHYGEAWGQHWLDVVRYADTSGFSNDWERSNIWRYRDYVIRSFNNDKPYNQFILEQIAGDEWKPNNPEMLVSVGYLRMGPWEHTPMSPYKVSRQLYLDDVVNNIGQTFLSTALRCCKCHDHKFDPLPTRDYYRIYAALSTTQLAERPAKFLPQESTKGFAESRKEVEELLAFAAKERDKLYAKREAAAKQWFKERGREKDYVGFQQRLRRPPKQNPPRFVGLTTDEQGILKIREQDVRIWTRRLERFQPMAQSVYSGGELKQNSIKLRMPQKKWEIYNSKKLPESFIYAGGSVFSEKEPVTPGVLSGIRIPTQAENEKDQYGLPKTLAGRRLALAKWIANPKNPLTTRSIVNRVWQYHFGRGIAANPNNFGTTGKKPTHPKLLDWLASEFVEKGWSIKKLHRLIMTSQVYQQASQHPNREMLQKIDPNNDLWAVFEPRRLTAEELRDSMLAITGELNREAGGLPVRPEINLEVALAPRMLQFSIAPAWQPSRTPEQRNRRSIYTYQVRGLANPLLEVFNKPGSDESCERRDAPSVTPQVFAMMNSQAVTTRSLAMAQRLQQDTETPETQIERGYQLTVGKKPDAKLTAKLLRHYQSMVDYHRKHQPKNIDYPTKITRSLVEELSGDPFQYEELLNVYQNYVPHPQASEVSAETRALADVCLLLLNSNAFIFIY